jgi:hypothetical protein
MSELADALEGAVGLLTSGVIFLLFAGTDGEVGVLSLSVGDALYLVVGAVVLVAVGVAAVGILIRRDP